MNPPHTETESKRNQTSTMSGNLSVVAFEGELNAIVKEVGHLHFQIVKNGYSALM